MRVTISSWEHPLEGPPDFVVEILSPETRRLGLENKKRIYARLGVKELWIIDPDAREVFSTGLGKMLESLSSAWMKPTLPPARSCQA
jgi:Uma2 family endonuclease